MRRSDDQTERWEDVTPDVAEDDLQHDRNRKVNGRRTSKLGYFIDKYVRNQARIHAHFGWRHLERVSVTEYYCAWFEWCWGRELHSNIEIIGVHGGFVDHRGEVEVPVLVDVGEDGKPVQGMTVGVIQARAGRVTFVPGVGSLVGLQRLEDCLCARPGESDHPRLRTVLPISVPLPTVEDGELDSPLLVSRSTHPIAGNEREMIQGSAGVREDIAHQYRELNRNLMVALADPGVDVLRLTLTTEAWWVQFKPHVQFVSENEPVFLCPIEFRCHADERIGATVVAHG